MFFFRWSGINFKNDQDNFILFLPPLLEPRMSSSVPQAGAQLPRSTVGRIFLWLSLGSVLLITVLLAWHSLGGLDIWLHNQVGRDILSGQFPDGTNTYSYTQPDHSWTNHEWLFQVLVAAVGPGPGDQIGPGIDRWNTLRLLLSVLLVGYLLLGDGCWRKLRPGSASTLAASWLGLPFLMGLFLLWPRLLLRPELISALFLAALVRTLDRPTATWRHPPQWWSLVHPRWPLGRAFWLTVAWTQFHGFSALGPAILLLAGLLAWLPGRFQEGPRGPVDPGWLLGLPLLMLALCLSPSGVQGLIYPLKALGQFRQSTVDLQANISELVPLLSTRNSLGWTMLAYQLSLVWGAVWIVATWGRTSPLRIVIWAASAYAAYLAQRNLGLYGVSFMLLHTGTTGAPVWNRFLGHRLIAGKFPTRWAGPMGILITVGLAALWSVQLVGDGFYLREGVSRRFGAGATPGRYLEESATLLTKLGATRVLANVDAAGFLLDRTEARVFIDGRTEAYSPDHWARYEDLKRAQPATLARLDQNENPAIALSVNTGSFLDLALALAGNSRWQVRHWDASGFLFLPARSPGSAWIAPPMTSRLPTDDTPLTPVRAADLCLAWAQAAEIVGDAAGQEQALRRGLAFRADHPTLHHNLGNLLMAREDWAAALPHFLAALKVNSRLGGSAQNAGFCQMRLQKPALAEQLFLRATQLDPSSVQTWVNLAISRLAAGHREEARQALRRAQELDPGNPRVRALLQQVR
jgi:tetratricopeptide (TPR) repeat protein